MNTFETPSGEAGGAAARGAVVAVNVLFEVRDTDRPGHPTGIDKRPVSGDVAVGELGVAGDRQVDQVHHGGPDRAVYAYAAEDLDWWAAQLDRRLTPGLFGENLTLAGVDVTGAIIGERWLVGGNLLLEVTMPRTPCYKFAHRMGEKRWIRRFNEAGMPGAYLRVLAEGPISEGDEVVVVRRPDHGVTLGDTFPEPRPEPMARLLAAADDGEVRLAQPMRERAEHGARQLSGS
ncbi:MOSC domain-containing protein [Georgenia sp. MJ173]|uniref:MOSC domain-containing protein n=1 Tax=Georgenia sunbinii TaxID=3117728 RepID=UPI002F2658BA